MMSVHYTSVLEEVVAPQTALVDIDSEECAAAFDSSVGNQALNVRQSVKLSVTYDIARIDELSAV